MTKDRLNELITRARQVGIGSGLEVAQNGKFTPEELEDEAKFVATCQNWCENNQDMVGHPGEHFNQFQSPERDALWDAFNAGEETGIRAGWSIRRLAKLEKTIECYRGLGLGL